MFAFLWSHVGWSRGLCWSVGWLVIWLWAPAAVLFLLDHRLASFGILMQAAALGQNSTFQLSAFSHNYRLTFVLCTFKGGSCYKLPQVEKKQTQNNSSILEGAPNKLRVCPLTFSSWITQARRSKQWLTNKTACREKVTINNATEEHCVDK